MSPDGTWIVSAGDDQTLKIWDAATGAERATLTATPAGVRLCGEPGRRLDRLRQRRQTLKIWDAASGDERATLTGHTDAVNGCAVSPDGTWIVSASDDGTLRIWDAATGAERAVLVLPGAATAVAFHPSHRWWSAATRVGVCISPASSASTSGRSWSPPPPTTAS